MTVLFQGTLFAKPARPPPETESVHRLWARDPAANAKVVAESVAAVPDDADCGDILVETVSSVVPAAQRVAVFVCDDAALDLVMQHREACAPVFRELGQAARLRQRHGGALFFVRRDVGAGAKVSVSDVRKLFGHDDFEIWQASTDTPTAVALGHYIDQVAVVERPDTRQPPLRRFREFQVVGQLCGADLKCTRFLQRMTEARRREAILSVLRLTIEDSRQVLGLPKMPPESSPPVGRRVAPSNKAPMQPVQGNPHWPALFSAVWRMRAEGHGVNVEQLQRLFETADPVVDRSDARRDLDLCRLLLKQHFAGAYCPPEGRSSYVMGWRQDMARTCRSCGERTSTEAPNVEELNQWASLFDGWAEDVIRLRLQILKVTASVTDSKGLLATLKPLDTYFSAMMKLQVDALQGRADKMLQHLVELGPSFARFRTRLPALHFLAETVIEAPVEPPAAAPRPAPPKGRHPTRGSEPLGPRRRVKNVELTPKDFG